MIREHDLIVLASDLPEFGLKEGDLGTVIDVHGNEGFEVEFITVSGETVAVVTLERKQVRAVGQGEMHHARPMERHA